jgi:hypothetical protein
MAVLGSDEIGYGGAGPLGVILAAYVSGCIWTDQGWEVEEVIQKFAIIRDSKLIVKFPISEPSRYCI